MKSKPVKLTHPKLPNAEIEVPETAVKHYARSGWAKKEASKTSEQKPQGEQSKQ